MQSLFRSADLSLGRLFFVRDSEVAEQLLRGWIHPDQAEAGSVNPDLLCPSESFHHLAVGVVLQYLFLLRIVEYAIREQRGKKTHEFTSVDRIVAVDPGLVEFAGLLVIPHHRLDLPTPGIGIIDFLWLHVEVAFQYDCPEFPLLLPEFGIVVSVCIPSEEVRLFLRSPSLVPERIEELSFSFYGILLVQDSLMPLKHTRVFVHRMSLGKP